MRPPASTLVASLALAAIAAAPVAPSVGAAAEDAACRVVDVSGSDEPVEEATICEQQLFVRAGGAPLSNATSAVFSLDAPSAAPVGGAGLGGSATDIAAQGDPAHGLEVTGTFVGAVDAVDVEVYLFMPNGAALGSHGTTPTIELDGFDVANGLVVTTVEPAGDGIVKATFRLEGLLGLWDALKYSYDVDAEHTIRLNLSPFYVGDDGAYLYDGTDVPSNVVLNAEA